MVLDDDSLLYGIVFWRSCCRSYEDDARLVVPSYVSEGTFVD